MSAVAVVEVEVEEIERCYDQVVAEALDAFASDTHYLEDMVKMGQRVLAKRSVRLVTT